MTHIRRIRAGWTGFPGAPGVSTFYVVDSAGATPVIRAFFDSIKGLLPSDVHIQVENVGDTIEDTTGVLVDTWGDDVVDEVVGSSGGVYAAPTGGMVGWETSTILDGRKVRGRTFLVPLASECFQTDGSLGTTTIGTISDAASTMTTAFSEQFYVWHRPRAARAVDGSRPAVTARAGGHAAVTLSRVPDEAVVLRSRRD